MKKAGFAVLCGALALAAVSPAGAQAIGKPSFALSAALGVPTGPEAFSDYWGLGIGAGLAVDVSGGPSLDYTFDLDLNYFGFDEKGFLADIGASGSGITVDGAAATVVTGMMGVKFHMPDPAPAQPYFQMMAGLGHLSTGDATVSDGTTTVTIPGDSENKVALGIGAGVQFRPAGSRVGYHFGARWVGILTSDETTHLVPIRVGISF